MWIHLHSFTADTCPGCATAPTVQQRAIQMSQTAAALTSLMKAGYELHPVEHCDHDSSATAATELCKQHSYLWIHPRSYSS